jgi:hypothetical protein
LKEILAVKPQRRKARPLDNLTITSIVVSLGILLAAILHRYLSQQ